MGELLTANGRSGGKAMNERIRTVWLDVTDLGQWSGHMTGVQRVVYENMCRLHSDESVNAKGFSYDPYRNEIFEVNLHEVIARFETATNIPDGGASRSSRLKDTAREMYFRIPSGVRTRITPGQKRLAKEGAKKMLGAAHHSLHQVRSLRARMYRFSSAESTPAALIAPHDTVLVLGKIWDSTPLVNLMATRKRQIGFTYVQLVHDLIPLFQPQVFGEGLFDPYAQYAFETLASADTILCVSRSTERDVHRLARELHFPEPHTVVVELGDSPLIDLPSERPSFVGENERFILSVGTVEARKNHQLLYQAWKLARERKVELPRLIVVGSVGWLVENMLYTIQHDPDTKNSITIHHGVSDAQKKWLFEHCLFTVFPSIYEGWGLPIAESLAYGKVCVASKASSMPEIAGQLLDYCSPFSTDELLLLLERYVDPKSRRAKEQEIVKQYRSRSWQVTYDTIKASL